MSKINRKKLDKLETLVGCTVLVGLSMGFAYGAFKGYAHLIQESTTAYYNYCMRAPADFKWH